MTAVHDHDFAVGSLVAARGREWVVLPESEPPNFLVLRPLGGDDAEKAGIFPALEQVEHAQFAAPDPADAGNSVSAGMLRTALRIGFRSTAGPFRSLAGLAVEPRPYQLVPLLMALRQEVVRLLIADDVGIGKTIEAGLIAAELLAQGDATGLAVLCSPALADQWHKELATKFGIHTELVLPSTVTKLQRGLLDSETLFDRHRHLVISTDFIKRPGLREQFWRSCPDLVIVDEAHTSVTDGDGSGGRARMLRHELLQRLAADPARHLLLVTATPHSGKEEGFRNLLGLLHPDLVGLDLARPADRERLAGHFIQRRRPDIRHYLEDTPLPGDRQRQEIAYNLTADYRELFDDILDYARTTVRDDAGGRVRQRVRYWSALALLRSLASSPRAAAATLLTRAGGIEATDPDEADMLGRSVVLDLPDDETQESADITPGADTEAETGESAHRRKLRRFAQRAKQLEGAKDGKLGLITKIVEELVLDGFNPVVFCRFIDTAEYVAEHLTSALGDAYRVAAVTGALPPEERQQRIAELAAEPEIRPVLVATDCLSEGINLQENFQAVVHYDLAWNPIRHEQREGRVDRFGQRAPEVRAVTIYGADTRIDGIVLDVLLRKHVEIRKALGISVPVPDRSDAVVEAILEGLLLRESDGHQLTLDGMGEEQMRVLHRDWDSALENEKRSRTKYAQERIKPAEVAQELDEIRASLGTAQDITTFVREALHALQADVSERIDGFTATTTLLPPGLRDAMPPSKREPLPFRRDLPLRPGEAHLDRTDPTVAAVARYVVESALDSSLPEILRPARRSGVIRTSAVTKRTTLLLVRFRFQVELPGRVSRQTVCEEAQVLAFRGRPSNPSWLTDDELTDLLAAQATANIPSDQAMDFIAERIEALPELLPHLDEVAESLAERLRQAHIRVREAGSQRVRRQISVTAQKPADVLGIYIYLPGGVL